MKWLVIPRFDLTVSAARISAALLILRLIVGVAFLFHGYDKIMNPFSWMGPAAPFPGFVQSLAALAEFGGGLAMIFGLLTPLVALGLMIDMAVAILTVHLPSGDPFIGGFELPLVFLVVFLVLFNTGPGRYSLDHLFFKRHSLKSDSRERAPERRRTTTEAPAH